MTGVQTCALPICTAPPAEYAADLFWLLHQGHILLYTDDTLVVQDAREANAAEPSGEPKKKKKKKKGKKPKAEVGEVAADSPIQNSATLEEAPTEIVVPEPTSIEETSPMEEATAPVSEATAADETATEVPAEREPEAAEKPPATD